MKNEMVIKINIYNDNTKGCCYVWWGGGEGGGDQFVSLFYLFYFVTITCLSLNNNKMKEIKNN